MSQASQVRTYDRAASVVFLKTNERFGGLSNMAPGFPLRINGIRIRTSEALYQACRFPHMPDVQRLIIEQNSPMTAKMRSKPYRKQSRPDWDAVRVKVMRWCLRVKLAQNWREFGRLLLATGERPIVEQSKKDDFWGAKIAEDGSLVGMNVLGRLLMELREQLKDDAEESLKIVTPLSIPRFLLLEREIEAVDASGGASLPARAGVPEEVPDGLPQPSLFDQPAAARVTMDTLPNRMANRPRQDTPSPYPTYRDSGLPWLGRIPGHWDVRRNGRLFAQRNDTGHEDLPILEVSLRTGVRVRDLENGGRKQIMTDRSKYKRAAKGDIAYNMMRMWQGAVGVAPVDGLISPAYVVASPFPEADPRYYSYLFRTGDYMREVNKFSRGIVSDRNRLYWDEFKQMPSAFPPTEEQTQIADFLDAHGRLASRLIRNKRRLIGLLNEQKQAIINQAVTRGLNPNAPMKPTGIDLIPEVPAHWEVKPLKKVAEVLFSNVDKHSHEGEADVLLCNYTDVYKNDFILADMPFMKATATPAEIERFRLEIGDVMITKDSESWNDIGVPSIVSEELAGVLCGYHLALIRADRKELVPMFLFRAFTASAIEQQLHVEATGVTRYGLSKLSIKNLLIPLPPADEQADIVADIGTGLEPLSSSISRVNEEISLVREYHERLVADVVTGKLDVRHVEIVMPNNEIDMDEAEELEADEEMADGEMMEGDDADD